ncbi:hypothetical protein Sulku_1370 [Sulfuricurvum kujiense DSM 16994]|uniref:Periplasmic protein n=2 Tax=Sulfuricurvum kujiense TaxID=148813 RepID=E4TYP1_SULKY|nr:hypothetical protein Sulku_1370 [Sulfuricurvum kujiense DSM 16994]
MIFLRLAFILSLMFVFSQGKTMVIRKSSDAIHPIQTSIKPDESIKIAVVSSPKIIGKYAQSVYNVALATLSTRRSGRFSIQQYTMQDESSITLAETFAKLREDKMDAVLAPLTGEGAKNLVHIETHLPIFIPTVHKRDIPSAPDNITFGGIDYLAQIEALLPYMADSISIFYDTSPVGSQLKSSTEEVFLAHEREKKKVRSYAVDFNGDNIISHLSKPSLFNKNSVILHIPVVKSAILASQLTFIGIKERNILSTQINMDPNLLVLTQYRDRKNMIIANSLVEFPPSIYEANELMNNDLAYDWIQYSSSVGIDYLVSMLDNTPRAYTMRLINSQVIYPVELLHAKEYGFESVTSK